MVTVVDLRQMQNKPGAPSYPASTYTLHAEDWNRLYAALVSGTKGIFTKGAKIGSEGIELDGVVSITKAASGLLVIRNLGAVNTPVVGSLSGAGELALQAFRVNQRITFAADGKVVLEGDRELVRPKALRTHDTVVRDSFEVEDLDLFNDGDLFGVRRLSGTFLSDAIGHGFAFRNGSGVSQIYLNADGKLVLRDVVDPTARPWTYENERFLTTGIDAAELVADVLGVDGVVVETAVESPRILQVGLALAGVTADRLAVGPSSTELNVDELWNRGGGQGDAATLVTPAERESIGDHEDRLAALEAEIATKISSIRTPAGQLVEPNESGIVQLVNSASVLFDRPAEHMLRAVATGVAEGEGGAVTSITAGLGLENTGTSADVVLDVKLGDGLEFDGDEIVPTFGTAAGTVAEGDHTHTGVYSPVGHTHTGVYVPAGGAYADLVAGAKIGPVAGKVAAGDDARFAREMFQVAILSEDLVEGDNVLGNGAAGLPAATDGKIKRLIVQTDKALAGGTSVTFRVKNLTTAGFIDVTIIAGQRYKTDSLDLPVSAEDEIGIICQDLVGIPDAGLFNVYVVKQAA